MMDELKELLINVSDSYYDFVVSILSFAKKKDGRADQLTKFMKTHPEAQTSEIIEYVSKEMDLMSEHIPFEARSA